MSGTLQDAFSGCPVFLTGHTGFKGSWLAVWLARLGAKVTGYALAPATSPSNFEAARVRELLAQHHEADIRDHQRLADAMRLAQPRIVFHLAAQALVRESYRTPRETFETNAIGTAAVLDAVRGLETPCVVIVVTSDKCYENREHVWGYREIDPMGGHDPYSASKGCAELLTAAYRRSFFPPDRLGQHGVKLASVRAGNVIGGGDWSADRIVTDIIRHLVEGKSVPVRSPRAVRPWQHVLEPLSGYMTLAARMLDSDDPRWCDGWNFGPLQGDDVPVSELVGKLIAAWGEGSWEDVSSPDQPHEANVLRLSVDKAMNQLGWRPTWTLAETIRRTAEWYHAYYSPRRPDMQAMCLQDIIAYEAAKAQVCP